MRLRDIQDTQANLLGKKIILTLLVKLFTVSTMKKLVKLTVH